MHGLRMLSDVSFTSNGATRSARRNGNASTDDWSEYSVGTWNPFAKVGSEEAAKARPVDAGPCTSMSFPLLLTAVIV